MMCNTLSPSAVFSAQDASEARRKLSALFDGLSDPEACCCLDVAQADGQLLHIQGPLLLAAAALNDLPLLRRLLDKGASPACDPAQRWQEMTALLIRSCAAGQKPYTFPLFAAGCFGDGKKGTSARPPVNMDPLSAAILLGSTDCALRLLDEVRLPLSPAVRWAMGRTSSSEAFLQTKAAVIAALGQPLAALLNPDDFESCETDDYCDALRRHPHQSPARLDHLLDHFDRPYAEKALRLTDRTQLGRHLPGYLLRQQQMCFSPLITIVYASSQYTLSDRGRALLDLLSELGLSVDRSNPAFGQLSWHILQPLLDRVRVTGSTPEGVLDPLTTRLLSVLFQDGHTGTPQTEWSLLCAGLELLRHPRFLPLLETQDRTMISTFIQNELLDGTPHRALLLQKLCGLLPLPMEVNTYEL